MVLEIRHALRDSDASNMDNPNRSRLMVKQKYDPQDFDARDVFAALALAGLLANDKEWTDDALCELAYDLADTMLKTKRGR
jgi:hypothetical protein